MSRGEKPVTVDGKALKDFVEDQHHKLDDIYKMAMDTWLEIADCKNDTKNVENAKRTLIAVSQLADSMKLNVDLLFGLGEEAFPIIDLTKELGH